MLSPPDTYERTVAAPRAFGATGQHYPRSPRCVSFDRRLLTNERVAEQAGDLAVLRSYVVYSAHVLGSGQL